MFTTVFDLETYAVMRNRDVPTGREQGFPPHTDAHDLDGYAIYNKKYNTVESRISMLPAAIATAMYLERSLEQILNRTDEEAGDVDDSFPPVLN